MNMESVLDSYCGPVSVHVSLQGLGLLNSTDPWESLELKHRPRGGNTSLGAGVSLYCAVGRVTSCISGVSPNWCGSYLRPWVA